MMINEIEKLINSFSRLPGLGSRSARRIVIHLLKYREKMMIPLAESVMATAKAVKTCTICGNLDTNDPCGVCMDANRDKTLICVTETVADMWAIERGKIFNGYYHVLGGSLSISDNQTPDELNIDSLISKVQKNEVAEVILATNATLDGQTTAYYITEKLKPFSVKISRIAYGVPVGGELDYLDEGTLGAAMRSRQPF